MIVTGLRCPSHHLKAKLHHNPNELILHKFCYCTILLCCTFDLRTDFRFTEQHEKNIHHYSGQKSAEFNNVFVKPLVFIESNFSLYFVFD